MVWPAWFCRPVAGVSAIAPFERRSTLPGLLDDPRACLFVAADGYDTCSFSSKVECDCTTDVGSGTGDDHDLSSQHQIHCFLLVARACAIPHYLYSELYSDYYLEVGRYPYDR
jgi:hypothetical protein